MDSALAADAPDAAPPPRDPWNNPLIYAGLGMLAGRSPYALENIGSGALEGLRLYDSVRARDMQQQQTGEYRQSLAEQRQANAAEMARHHQETEQEAGTRLADLAERTQADLARQAEQQRHDQASEGQGRWTYAGNDPATGKPVLVDSRTGQTRMADQAIGARPGATLAANARAADTQLAQREADIRSIMANAVNAGRPMTYQQAEAEWSISHPAAGAAGAPAPAPAGGTTPATPANRPPLSAIFGH